MDGETNEAKATKILERFESQSHLFFACEHDKDATVKARELWDAYFSDCFDEAETFLMGLRAKAFEAEKSDSTQDRAAHTPEALEVFSYFIQCDGEHAERFGVTRKGPTVILDVFGDSRDVRKARAHLFAAAPDLLAALEGMVAEFEGMEFVGPTQTRDRILNARAALAKATATPTGSNESPIVGGTP